MSDTEREKLEPHDRPARRRENGGYNWPHLVAGALAGISILGAAVSSWSTGRASQSADNATNAKYLTIDVAERAKLRLDAFEAEQKEHDKDIASMDRRIETNLKHIEDLNRQAQALEKRLSEIEKKVENYEARGARAPP